MSALWRRHHNSVYENRQRSRYCDGFRCVRSFHDPPFSFTDRIFLFSLDRTALNLPCPRWSGVSAAHPKVSIDWRLTNEAIDLMSDDAWRFHGVRAGTGQTVKTAALHRADVDAPFGAALNASFRRSLPLRRAAIERRPSACSSSRDPARKRPYSLRTAFVDARSPSAASSALPTGALMSGATPTDCQFPPVIEFTLFVVTDHRTKCSWMRSYSDRCAPSQSRRGWKTGFR